MAGKLFDGKKFQELLAAYVTRVCGIMMKYPILQSATVANKCSDDDNRDGYRNEKKVLCLGLVKGVFSSNQLVTRAASIKVESFMYV